MQLHQNCCFLRGVGWNQKSKQTINVQYVFNHPYSWLFFYHDAVLDEIVEREIDYDISWSIENYRGPILHYSDPHDPFVEEDFLTVYAKEESSKKLRWLAANKWKRFGRELIYPEHDDAFMMECIGILQSRDVKLVNKETLNRLKLKSIIEGVDILASKQKDDEK